MAHGQPLELKLENVKVSKISCDEMRGGWDGFLMEVEVHLTETEMSRLGRNGLVEHYCDYIEPKAQSWGCL